MLQVIKFLTDSEDPDSFITNQVFLHNEKYVMLNDDPEKDTLIENISLDVLIRIIELITKSNKIYLVEYWDGLREFIPEVLFKKLEVKE